VLEVYLADLPNRRNRLAEALAEALEQGDASGLRLAAHSLKGVSASVGACAASQAAYVLEKLAQARIAAAAPDVFPAATSAVLSGAPPVAPSDAELRRALAELDEILAQTAAALGQARAEQLP